MTDLNEDQQIIAQNLCESYPGNHIFDNEWEEDTGIADEDLVHMVEEFEKKGWIDDRHTTFRPGGTARVVSLTTEGKEELC